jgi:carbamoyl-phosphate synthase large subunit
LARKTVTVLLTGVGAPGSRGTIYALRNNGQGRKVRIVGTDIREGAVGRYWTDAFFKVPPPEDDGYLDAINRAVRSAEADVVLPQTTRETVRLSETASEVRAPVAVSGAGPVRRANSKAELMAEFMREGLPSPRFHVVKSPAELESRARSLGYPDEPVVVKPSVSFGSRGFRVLRGGSSLGRRDFLATKPSPSETTLELLLGALSKDDGVPFPELIVSEYLPGDEYSVDAFAGSKGAVAVPRRRDEIVNGISFRTTVDPRDDLASYTLKAARSLGLTYAFGFQYKLDQEGVPKVLECNPRVQGTMVASLFAGVNVVWLAVREALGEAPPVPRPRLRRVTFQRFWGGVGALGGRLIGEI